MRDHVPNVNTAEGAATERAGGERELGPRGRGRAGGATDLARSRARLGYSLREVAAMIGAVHPQTVSAAEHHREVGGALGRAPHRLRGLERKMSALYELDRLPRGDIASDASHLFSGCDEGYWERRQMAIAALLALESLTAQEREVIALRTGIDPRGPLMLREVGDLFGFTRQRAQQIEVSGLQKLREALALGEAA